jgi:hypothetical protein
MSGGLEEEAFDRLAGFHEGTILVAFADIGGRLDDDVPLGASAVVTGQAIVAQDWKNLVLKVDGFVTLDFLYLESFPEGVEINQGERGDENGSFHVIFLCFE